MAIEWFVRNPKTIGGPGTEVEIDETYVFRRKYKLGRLPQNRVNEWLFGGVQRNTLGREVFLVSVQRRNAATLLPLIQQYILPGTRVISDQWASYNQIQNLPQNYGHDAVNHRYHFIDPNDATIHTQNVENMWLHFKRLNRPIDFIRILRYKIFL